MNRFVTPALLSLFVAAGCATTSTPGVTVGDLTSKGGKKLTSSEIKSLMTGATFGGAASGSGTPFKMTNRPDGTFTGSTSTGFNFQGTWSVNDKDQYCSVISTADARPGGPPCVYLYSADGKYYMVEAETPSAPARERTISR